MNPYKKLMKNSGIFAIGTLGSKLISILLVPFYTYVLSTQQYGTIDMITTSISLILPVITLSIFDATLRFTVKSGYDKVDILTSSIFILILGNSVLVLFYPVLIKISLLRNYIHLFYITIFAQSINSVLAQFCRGIGRVKEFSFNGVMNTFFNLSLNIVFLGFCKLGIEGYLFSIIISYIICNIYLVISTNIWKYICFENYNSKLLREMLTYSIPLIPNALLWWIMNASDRYIITLVLGVAANGIYAVAYKIPTVLNLVYSIFSQAWQLSAIEEGDSIEKNSFYTNVFSIFSFVMLCTSSFILIFIKFIVKFALSDNFMSSWKYVPFLLLAVVFTSFSSFLGSNYIAMKNTKGIFKTSMAGALVNIILNLILIPKIGLNGAAISTMISFLIVWIIRMYETREFVKIDIDNKRLMQTIGVIFAQVLVLYIDMSITMEVFLEITLFSIMLIINNKTIRGILVIFDKQIINKSTIKDIS